MHIPRRSIVPLAISITILLLGIWMWQEKIFLGLHRYFDIDEFAYLYWASHMREGARPYVDFLFYPAPGFFALLVPLVAVSKGIAVITTVRMAMLVLFGVLSIVGAFLFWEMRKSWTALLFPLFLVFLPLPSDKFLEIRPDTFAMVLFMLGLLLTIRFMNRSGGRLWEQRLWNRISPVAAGLFLCSSLVVSQKMVINVGIVLTGLLLWTVMNKKSWKHLYGVMGGIAAIGCLTLLYLSSLGNWQMVWYSLTRLSFEASNLGKLYPIPPYFFFLHNDVVYGHGGYHIGYFLNLCFWTTGILVAVLRFCTPTVSRGKQGMWQELIMSVVFLSSLTLFAYTIPMKHAQYLIPAAVFAVWYVVDGIDIVWKQAEKTAFGTAMFFAGWLLLVVALMSGYTLVNTPKEAWTNARDIEKMEHIWQIIPMQEPIFDMVGLTMKYPQPYVAPVLPVGQIAPLLSYPLPSVADTLKKTDTKFVYSGSPARFATLPAVDQEYIRSQYTQVGDGDLWIRNDVLPRFLNAIW